ncbi:lipoyl synthase [Parendozoicomonas sp. Alg238-R29]|uniref:lipoyl synthase n=1 Tax=Parendozoicomonas sp. Alg238-R29 TaxID=2993446 RepID=UPI00248E282B|nr:lipoyl synthase [Parendozoicomonas sp. Alg238-R29]
MSENIIPTVQVPSGSKFVNDNGIRAIKNGVKASQSNDPQKPLLRKPSWLRIKARTDERYSDVKKTVHGHKLSTVCEEAMCPNINECWSSGTATIMLMGDVCTRACKFCAVNTGNPKGWLDEKEPENTAESVKLMGLKYLVLTSVNRDDLEDGGAGHYAAVVKRVVDENPDTAVEALTPDFLGNLKDVETVVDSGISVFAQNVETVRRLTHPVRDPRASYEQTLKVLEHSKKHNPKVLTKTSIMLGLGETEDEIIEAMDDLRAIGVDILTFGQYLQPTRNHIELKRYVTPEEFEKYRQWGLDKGFLEVVSGALVRSSYRAEQVLQKNNVGLGEPAK